MKLIILGICLTLTSLSVLMAMVVGVLEPGLVSSLLSYAGAFTGTVLVIAGVIDRRRRR